MLIKDMELTRRRGCLAVRRVASLVEALESRLFLSTSWFVATTGADTNPGTISLPFRTIQHGADVAQAGDTVNVRAGTYRETVTVKNSGASGTPIVFQP